MRSIKALFLIALIASTLCIKNEGEVKKYYPIAVGLMRGLAKTETQSCASSVSKGEDEIVPAVEKAIRDIKDGKSITTVLIELAYVLMGVEGLMSECRILAMLDLVDKFTTKDGLREILQALIKNIDEVWEQGQKIIPAFKEQKFEEGGKAIGVIFRLGTDFYVN